MTDYNSSEFIQSANQELQNLHREPLSIEEYVDLLFEDPSLASHSAKYILEAIEFEGTRTVIENGEEMERYVFFDDPHNDSENAILGNTKELNEFVETIRVIASSTGKHEKIIWVSGPTATGKSELKRCLVSGLKAYSKTPDGQRYTLEWNTRQGTNFDPMYANDPNKDNDENWFESPVQTHPLAIFPEDTYEEVIKTLNAQKLGGFPITKPTRLDPASKQFFDDLVKEYKSKNRDHIFEQIIQDNNVRVSNYIVDIGKGIGILHSEDSGEPKQKLAGVWLSHEGLADSGLRDPLKYSYDGVLSQGNGGLTVIEDAASHPDLLTSLLNIMDEKEIKLDQRIRMPIDTVFLIISNPDLKRFLDQQQELEEADPMKALKRRMEKHEFRYLTTYGLESELLKKELSRDKDFSLTDSDPTPSASVQIDTYNTDNVQAKELAPHTLESAALFDVLTRLTLDGIPDNEKHDFSLIDKATIFEKGYLQRDETRYELEDTDFEFSPEDGRSGVPVTFTRDVLSELIMGDKDAPIEHKYESVLLPQDIITEIQQQLPESPLFTDSNTEEYSNKANLVTEYIFEQQKSDFLQASMKEAQASEELIEEYTEHVFAWGEGTEEVDFTGEVIKPDPLEMKIFETDHLGIFDDSDYFSSNKPRSKVKEFRRNRVINPINRRAWFNRTDDFRPGDLRISEINVFDSLLSEYTITDLQREFPDLNPNEWESPKDGSETAEVKQMVIENMQEQGYSKKSAELTAQLVIDKVSDQWD